MTISLYCNNESELSVTYIVPTKVPQSAEKHNIVMACEKCNASKGDKDLIEWWGTKRIDTIPRGIMKKYLKILYICLECAGVLDNYVLSENGMMDLLYIGHMCREYCDHK